MNEKEPSQINSHLNQSTRSQHESIIRVNYKESRWLTDRFALIIDNELIREKEEQNNNEGAVVAPLSDLGSKVQGLLDPIS